MIVISNRVSMFTSEHQYQRSMFSLMPLGKRGNEMGLCLFGLRRKRRERKRVLPNEKINCTCTDSGCVCFSYTVKNQQ